MGCRVVAGWDAGAPIMHTERLHLINYPTGRSRLLPYADNDAFPAIPLLRLTSPLAVLKHRCHIKKVSVPTTPGEEKSLSWVKKTKRKKKTSSIVSRLPVVAFSITFFNHSQEKLKEIKNSKGDGFREDVVSWKSNCTVTHIFMFTRMGIIFYKLFSLWLFFLLKLSIWHKCTYSFCRAQFYFAI